MRQKDIRPAPARIEFKGMKFLITDRPSDHNIIAYIAVSFFFTSSCVAVHLAHLSNGNSLLSALSNAGLVLSIKIAVEMSAAPKANVC